MQFHSLNICILKENKSLESIFAEDFAGNGHAFTGCILSCCVFSVEDGVKAFVDT